MANRVDQLLAAQGSDNPVDQAIADQSFSVKSSLSQAERGPDPDKYANVMRIARETNVPTDVAERNFDQVNYNANIKRTNVDRLIAKNPALTSWLENKDNANLSKDELDKLREIEDSVSEYSLLSQAYSSVKSGVAGTYARIAQVPALAYDIAALPQNYAYELAGSDRRVRSPEWLRNNPLADRYNKAAQEFAGEAPELSGDVWDLLSSGEITKASRTAFLQLANNAPNQVSLVASAMIAGPTAGLAFAGTQSAAGTNAELQEKGTDPLVGIPTAAAMGLTEAAFERLGTLSVIEKWQGAITQRFGQETARSFITNLGKTIAGNSIQEGLEEAGTSVAQDVLQAGTGTGDKPLTIGGLAQNAFNAGVIGALSSTTTTAPTVATIAAARAADIQEANRAKAFFLNLGQAAETTKLRERMPEAQATLMKGVAENTGVTDVYVDPEALTTFFQKSGDPAELAAKMGILDYYNQAQESGTFVKIPLADYATKVIGTDNWRSLADDIKFSPDGLTVNEAKIEQDSARAELEAVNQEAQGNATTPVTQIDLTNVPDEQLPEIFKTRQRAQRFLDQSNTRLESQRETMDPGEYSYLVSQNQKVMDLIPSLEDAPTRTEQRERRESGITKVRDNITGQLMSSGVTEREAKTQSLVLSEGLGALADAAGLTADQLTEQFPLSIRQGTQPQTGALNQRGDWKKEGYTVEISEDPFFDEDGNELDIGPITPENIQNVPSGTTFSFVAEDKNGEEVGRASFMINEGELIPDDGRGFAAVQIKPEHRRKGLANEMYRMAEEATGMKVTRSSEQTDDGRAFWSGTEGSFNQQGDDIQGQIQFKPTNETFESLISLFKSKNQSTFAHESAHYLFNVMGVLSEREGVSQRLKDDYKALLDFVGVESRGELAEVHQEKIARAWEAYLMEGKAPTKKLRRAFNQFKTWMSVIYRNVRGLEAVAGFDIQITPEVRSIFDRMLTSQEQVEVAEQTLNYNPLFSLAGMSDAQSQKYVDALADARIAADDQIRAELMEYETRKQKEFYKNQRESIQSQVISQVDQMPVYLAHAQITKGTMPDGSPLQTGEESFKLSRKEVVDQYGEDVAKLFPRGMFGSENIPIEMASDTFGFESPQDMVDQFSAFTPRADYIEQLTNQQMDEIYPDRMADPTISQDAILAYHNENRDRVYRMEMDYLLENAKGVPADTIRRLTRAIPSDNALKTQAANVVGAQVVSEIRPVLYSRAESKWNKDAADKFNAGDIVGALESKRKAALNNYLYKAAKEAQTTIKEDVKKFRNVFKKDADLKNSRDVDMVDAARSILVSYGIGPRNADFEDPASYLRKLQRYSPDTYAVVMAIAEPALENTDNYKNLTFERYKDMSLAVNGLWDYAKESKELHIEGKKISFEKVMEEANVVLDEAMGDKKAIGLDKAVTDQERRGMFFTNFMASYRKMQHWAYAFDKGNPNGFMTKYIVRPIIDGQTQFRLSQIELHKKLAEIGKSIDKDVTTKVNAPELGYEFKNKQELLHAILHTGNESNIQKLLLGRQNSQGVTWGTQNEDGTLDRSKWDGMVQRMVREGILTKQDFDTVQALWNLSEEIKPAAQKAHKRMYGYYFNEITANEFTITFPDGTTSTYAGGYAPAIVDPELSRDANIREMKNDAAENFNSSYMMPTTGSGFTKSRVDYNAPLQLDLSRLTSHFDKVLRFTHIEPAVKDVNRILRNKDFQNKMTTIDRGAIDQMITPWLSRVAVQRVVEPSNNKVLDKAANFLRTRVSAQIMAFNVPNWFQNFTGAFNALVRLDAKHMAGASRIWIKNPTEYSAMVQEKSEYMKTRMSDNVRMISKEYQDVINPQTKIEKFGEAANAFGFFGEKLSNGIVETVTWGGAYRQAVSNGQSETEAVKFADDSVRQLIGDMSVAGASTIETGSPFQRLFFMLSSFFFNSGNLLLSEAQIAKDLGWKGGGGKRAAQAYIFAVMAPAVSSAIIMRIFAGQGLDSDDDGEYADDIFDIFFVSQAKYLLAAVPFNSVLQSAFNRFNDKPYDDRITASPALTTLDSAFGSINTAEKILSGEQLKSSDIKSVLLAIGLATGLPSPILSRPLGYRQDVETGKANPDGAIDVVRGLVTGRPGN